MPGRETGLFCLYGRRPVLEALRLGLVRSLEIARGAHGRVIDDLINLAHERRIPIQQVEKFAESEEHTVQGVRAWAEPPPVRHDLWEFVQHLPDLPPPLVLMLDGITDPRNFGALLRTAEATGVSAVVVRKRRQAPLSGVAVKTSAGAAYLVPVFEVVNLSRALQMLTDEGFWSAVAVPDREAVSCAEVDWKRKTVLIVGAEGEGVADLLKRRADVRISIPMYGRLESLNVSVAAGVILYEAARARFGSGMGDRFERQEEA